MVMYRKTCTCGHYDYWHEFESVLRWYERLAGLPGTRVFGACQSDYMTLCPCVKYREIDNPRWLEAKGLIK